MKRWRFVTSQGDSGCSDGSSAAGASGRPLHREPSPNITCTEAPVTTGDSVNPETKRRLNTGKIKEDLNQFSSFFKSD